MNKEKIFVNKDFVEKLLELGLKCSMSGGDTIKLR